MTILHESVSLTEGAKDGQHYYIQGVFATIGVQNINKRVYPMQEWQREVKAFQNEIEQGTLKTLMEWDHSNSDLVDPQKAVAKINKLWIENNLVYGRAIVLDVPKADIIKAMIDNNVKISVSSRGKGNVINGVVSDFTLNGFDVVAYPSDKGATMTGVYESAQTPLSRGRIIFNSFFNIEKV